MNHATTSSTASGSTVLPDTPRTIAVDDDEGQLLLDAFDDPGCRAILTATGEEARSASELSERCDLPLSTAYRKLDLLADAGLVAESIRIRRSGKHTSEYARCVDGIHVTVAGHDGFEIVLVPPA